MPQPRWRSHDDILRSPAEPRPIAIAGIATTQDVILITGPYDAFKSSLALEMAYSLATGRPWLGRFPVLCKPMRIGIIQTEIEEGHYHKRLGAFPPTPNLEILTDFSFTLDRVSRLGEQMEEMGLDGLFLDRLGVMWPTYARSGEPFDENKKTHVSPLLQELKQLEKLLGLLHHDPKATAQFKGRASGSAALLNDPDVRLFLDRPESPNPGPEDRVKVQVRNRLQAPIKPFDAVWENRRLRA